LKRSADRLGEQNMIVHDQDANRCSSFPSTGNSISRASQRAAGPNVPSPSSNRIPETKDTYPPDAPSWLG